MLGVARVFLPRAKQPVKIQQMVLAAIESSFILVAVILRRRLPRPRFDARKCEGGCTARSGSC